MTVWMRKYSSKPIRRNALSRALHSICRLTLKSCRAVSMACASVGLLTLIALASPASGAAERADTDDIRGLWVDHRESGKRKVAIRIDDCDGRLCGRIYWLKKPLTANGDFKRDRHNPDVALRSRLLCGLKILAGFRRVKEATWSAGQIYDPSDGRIFSSTISLENDGSLKVRGYVGIPLFGRTVVWVRPEENLERCG